MKEALAKQLDGREYPFDPTPAEEKQAKAAGLVIIYGASDDLCELRGAIYDEVGCYNGGEVLIDRDGLLIEPMDSDDEEVLRKYKALDIINLRIAVKIEALWCETEAASWTYKTDFPHATFKVMEEGDVYCVGIVIDIKDIKQAAEKAQGAK